MKYAFINGKILDGTKDMQVREGLSILTDGERITGVVPHGAEPDGYETVDLGGRYIMPGLINMHVHLAGNGKPQKKIGTTRDYACEFDDRLFYKAWFVPN